MSEILEHATRLFAERGYDGTTLQDIADAIGITRPGLYNYISSKEQLLATLLVFRVLYFVIPFAIAISIMGTRELWLSVVIPWQQRRRLNEGFAAAAPASTPAAMPRPVERLEPVKRLKSLG